MKSNEILLQFFSENFPFNKEGLDELIHAFSAESYGKDALILRPNSTELELRFIENGFVREYYSSNFKDVNINFYGSNNFTTDLISFLNNSETHKYQQCLTEVNLWVLSKNKFEHLLEKYNCGQEIVQKSFQKILLAKESLERKRITMTKDELYKDLQMKKPDWLLNIPQYHIASYLNITPETLSRIRKRIS